MRIFAGYTPDNVIRNIMHCQAPGAGYAVDTGLSTIEVGPEVGIGTHYIAEGVALEKQLMPLVITNTHLVADGLQEAVISGIPEGVQVEWPDGQTDIVTGGEIRFSVDLAGTYTFRFTAVPYLDKEVVIEAIPAA